MSSDPKFFNNSAYNDPRKDELSPRYDVDGTDALANKGFVLSFWHVPSKRSVYFKAFITAFNETYSSDWSGESVYGRADPIYMFKQTQRKITLAFKIPCSTAGEGYENLSKVQKLIQFLYPSYEDPASATTITQSPLIRLKVMNLLTNAQNGAEGQTPEQIFDNYSSTRDANLGLLGAINNLTVNHNLENPDIGVIEKPLARWSRQEAVGSGVTLDAILPKMIEVNLDFSAIHETALGWENSTNFSNTNFPYGSPNMDVDDSMVKTPWADQPEYAAGWDVATIVTGSNSIDTSLYPALDREQEEPEGYTPEQDAANAEARYAGVLGDFRYKQDVKKHRDTDNEYIKSSMRGEWESQNEGAQTVFGTELTNPYDY